MQRDMMTLPLIRAVLMTTCFLMSSFKGQSIQAQYPRQTILSLAVILLHWRPNQTPVENRIILIKLWYFMMQTLMRRILLVTHLFPSDFLFPSIFVSNVVCKNTF